MTTVCWMFYDRATDTVTTVYRSGKVIGRHRKTGKVTVRDEAG